MLRFSVNTTLLADVTPCTVVAAEPMLPVPALVERLSELCWSITLPSAKVKTISPAEPEDTSTVTPAALKTESKLEATAPPDAAVSVAEVE